MLGRFTFLICDRTSYSCIERNILNDFINNREDKPMPLNSGFRLIDTSAIFSFSRILNLQSPIFLLLAILTPINIIIFMSDKDSVNHFWCDSLLISPLNVDIFLVKGSFLHLHMSSESSGRTLLIIISISFLIVSANFLFYIRAHYKSALLSDHSMIGTRRDRYK